MSATKDIVIVGVVGVVGWYLYELFFAAPAPAANVVPVTGAAPTSTPAAGTTPVTPTPILDQTYTALVQVMTSAGDPAITNVAGVISASPDVFNWYLVNRVPNSPVKVGPDLSMFAGASLLTSQQYWAQMAPYLQRTLGLNGLGYFAGLGCYLDRCGLTGRGTR